MAGKNNEKLKYGHGEFSEFTCNTIFAKTFEIHEVLPAILQNSIQVFSRLRNCSCLQFQNKITFVCKEAAVAFLGRFRVSAYASLWDCGWVRDVVRVEGWGFSI